MNEPEWATNPEEVFSKDSEEAYGSGCYTIIRLIIILFLLAGVVGGMTSLIR